MKGRVKEDEQRQRKRERNTRNKPHSFCQLFGLIIGFCFGISSEPNTRGGSSNSTVVHQGTAWWEDPLRQQQQQLLLLLLLIFIHDSLPFMDEAKYQMYTATAIHNLPHGGDGGNRCGDSPTIR